MAQQQKPVDYDALAAQVRAATSATDYDALEKQVNAVPSHETPAEPSFFDLPLMEQKRQLLIGAAKGALNTTIGLGELVHKIPGVSAVIDKVYGTPGLSEAAFPVAREAVKPQTTGEEIGKFGEQTAEFFLPVGKVGKIGTLAEIAKNATLTGAQTGSLTDAVVSGGLTAATPYAARLLPRMSSAARGSATRTVERALGPTVTEMKVTARDIAPEVLKRGIKGSREAMLDTAKTQIKTYGSQLDQEFTDAAKRGEAIAGDHIRDVIQKAKRGLMEPDANGVLIEVPGTEDAIRQLDKLHAFTERMGDSIPIDKARHIRQIFDDIVDKAGLFGAKATASATDASKAWSTREAANAFRDLINNRNATIADLNKEMEFWQGLRDVTQASVTNQIGKGGSGLLNAAAGVAGGAMAFPAFGFGGGFAGYVAGQQLAKLMQSPSFRTRVSAPLKNMLADALATGNNPRAIAAIRSMSAQLPALGSR